MTTRLCACCGHTFTPRPQVPGQTYCSSPDCQKARKRQWQRTKLQTDPDYRGNQRAAQKAWSERNSGYWQKYRAEKPEKRQKNSRRQHLQKQPSINHLVKMDVFEFPNGIYRIVRIGQSDGNSWIVKITPVG